MKRMKDNSLLRRPAAIFGVLVAFMLVAASCGSSGGTDTTEANDSDSETTTAESEASGEDLEFATVVKLTGVAWFDRMEEGVNDFGEDNEGISTFQQGPAESDAALQVQVIEDLIARDVDVINVVPFQPDTVEPVLKKARDAGIVVIGHEGASLENVDYDIEAFDNAAYGRHLMDELAKEMGETGEYAVFVGSLTSETHNIWVDSAIEHQKETYPDMTWVGDKVESTDDADVAYTRTQELLAAFPNLKGIQGSSSLDVVGVGQAIDEAGLQDNIAVVGTSVPSISSDLLETGAIDLISFWDPALAGYAMNSVAKMVVEGETPESGMDLGLEGYDNIVVEGSVISGSAWIDVTTENVDDYPF